MKLVLIDRDGVINEELPHYVKTPDELVIPEPALKGLALLRQHGFACVIVTNQSCVGRGIITADTLDRIHDRLRETVADQGGAIIDIFACTDHPKAATHRRKPAPGMLLEAMEKYRALPASTPFIGDAPTDMEAAHAAGCPRYLVMTGKGRDTARALPEKLQPVTLCDDLLSAARKIVETYG
jgi:D-glycero-D-manno-heptose 1,7-bisphosphate phosphatase